MSSWNIGIDDVSEETQALKNKLSSQGMYFLPTQSLASSSFCSLDGHIAAQNTQLIKQAAELEEIKSTLNDTLHKVCN
jgi:myosin protein heavy chain